MRIPWLLQTPPSEAVSNLVRHARLTELQATLLASRGLIEPEVAKRHLQASPMGLHDPFLLPDMEPACERIVRALRDRETVLIHGDYDVDGVTGTALLTRLFQQLGGKVEWHIPNRLVHGYSFGDHSIERAEEVGATLVISVDNGTSEHEVIGRLKERGIDTIVTDHHEPPQGPLPEAVAIVNPKLPGSDYPWRELCGGAVAFKLAWGVCQKTSRSKRVPPELKDFLEDATTLVAIATVCDVVPLLDENRILARFGLKSLARTRQSGLRALLRLAKLADGRPTAEDVAFQIGPRINASGRLGGAERAVELLLCNEPTRAEELARELDRLNQERKEIEAEVLEEARAQAARFADPEEHPVLILGGKGWHQGVVGIVAARITEEFHRPAVCIGFEDELGRGSARSVENFSVLEALRAGAAHMERFGGHSQAAGLEMRRSELDALRNAVARKARAMLAEAPPSEPVLRVDCELPFAEMNDHTMGHLDLLAPFGERNEKPVLLSRDLRLAEPARAVGQGHKHLLLRLRRGEHVLKAMAFRMGDRIGELEMGAPIDIVYTPRWNAFRGEIKLELQLLDFHVHAPGAGVSPLDLTPGEPASRAFS